MMWVHGLGMSYLIQIEMFLLLRYVILESLSYASLSLWVVITYGMLPSQEHGLLQN